MLNKEHKYMIIEHSFVMSRNSGGRPCLTVGVGGRDAPATVQCNILAHPLKIIINCMFNVLIKNSLAKRRVSLTHVEEFTLASRSSGLIVMRMFKILD